MRELSRGSVTVASQVMLPAYVALFGSLGLLYILTPAPRLMQSPALRYAGSLMPVHVWGCLFAAVAVVLTVALLTHRRMPAVYALWLGIVLLVSWALVFLAGFLFADAVPSTFLWPLFGAVCCYASSRSVLKGEV